MSNACNAADHVCKDFYFDRTICECGWMHYRCEECGAQSDCEDCWAVDSPGPPIPARTSVLQEAEMLTNGDRNNSYGPPTQDFARTAEVLNALGYRGPGGRKLVAHDTAVMVAAVKLSRITWSPEKRDHWVDLAGYAACGFECVEEEGKNGTD